MVSLLGPSLAEGNRKGIWKRKEWNGHRAWLAARASLLVSNVGRKERGGGGIYLNTEERGQLHSARLIQLFIH